MIEAVRKGNLLDAPAQTLVNTVNTVGVMGKGIALEFRQRFPDMFTDYQRRCAEGRVRVGEPYLWRGRFDHWIINFPTKRHWRSASRIADIERGLSFLSEHLVAWGVTSMAVPPLGAGHGGLDWATVGPRIYRHLDALPIPIVLYAPFQVPDEEATVEFLTHEQVPPGGNGRLDPSWMAIAEIVRRIDQDSYAWPVGRLRLQKLAYFATQAGLPTGLEYVESTFGPFTHDLAKPLAWMVNNGVLEERPAGRMHIVRPGPSFADAIGRNREAVERHEATIRRVVDLLARIDNRHTEIASSVHFAAGLLRSELGRRPTELEVLRRVERWKQRRRQRLEETEIALTIRDLGALDWLDMTRSDDLPPGDAMVTVA
jgi:O-acetyl-ADP-ribose deacetylase (regulator of RNase III)/uncharacterized protein YwgA